MIQVGQIDKTQYGLKRNKFRQNYNNGANKISPDNYNLLTDSNSNTKPLQVRDKARISFRGFNILALPKTLKPVVKPIPEKLTEKVFKSLKNISSTQYEYYQKVRKEYVDFIKLPTESTTDAKELLKREAGKAFRKSHGISDEIAGKISEQNLYYLPQKSLPVNFVEQVVAPIKFLYKSAKRLVVKPTQEQAEQAALEKKILKDFASLQGLINSHEIWENGYRRMSGHQKWTPNSEFLIPNDVLYGKILRRRNKVVDPNKGKYSSTSMMLGNRLISGLVYSYFLGTDAYNTTMRYSNNEKEAAVQRNSRVAQEFSRIGMNMYVQNLLFGTFEAAVNKSLATAMFVSGSTTAFSEILGRKLVGKPIMPSDKETLDRLEEEMNSKKGILPAIGRLLTNVKKKDTSLNASKTSEQNTNKKLASSSPANKKLFSSFTKTNEPSDKVSFSANKAQHTPSFKGFYNVDHLLDKKKLTELMKIIELADEKTAETIKSTIMKSVKKSHYFDNLKALKPQSFDELMSSGHIEKIPVGQDKTTWGLWTTSILVPVKFVKNLSVSLYKNIRKLMNSIMGVKNNALLTEFKTEQAKNSAKYKEFLELYKNRMELPVWKTSKLSEEEKQLKIYSELKGRKDSEEIQGAKNILLWLEKQLKREKIQLKEDGTIDADGIEKVKKLLMDSVLQADSSKHVEYDGNILAQANINLSRAITTLFLMADSYNLTMQYSNDNKKDAQKSASNRAAQEISRIGVSAYLLAFVHNLLSKLCNSSLAGAFTLTALTSSINDSLSRKVVGVPLTAKTQEELHELDKENAKSKSPIKKALAYSIGKKSAMPKANTSSTAQKELDHYFDNDFFIKPEIF